MLHQLKRHRIPIKAFFRQSLVLTYALPQDFNASVRRDADVAALKSVGLSSAKTTYIRSLAEHVVSGALDIDHIDTLPDDEVRRQITSVKGLGPWTADMFLLIHLQRPDVLSGGDLGIRQAVQRLYKLDHLPSVKEVDEIGLKWRPHRSLAGFYLWASNRTVPAARATAKSRGR